MQAALTLVSDGAHDSGWMPLSLQVTSPGELEGKVFRYEFDVDRAKIVLGRRGGVDVLLPQPSVSLVHAHIERRGGGYFLVDEGSDGGTLLNGVPVPSGKRVALRSGDSVGIGEFLVQIAIDDDGWSASSSGTVARDMAREVLGRLGPGQSQPSLEVLDGPQAGVVLALVELGRTYVLGRAGDSDLRLDDVDLWRDRAALVRDTEGVSLRDLGAKQALSVNGERVNGERRLHDGDVLSFSGSQLRFRDPAEQYLKQLETSTPRPGARAPVPVAQEAAPVVEKLARRAPRRGGENALLAVALILGAAALVAAGYIVVLLVG
jgi:pSer/pThr/pTyr-binding forkhead associated (FHA) protein